MFMYRHQNSGKIRNLMTANKYFDIVAKFEQQQIKIVFTKKLRTD